jgi:hypothetical protein
MAGEGEDQQKGNHQSIKEALGDLSPQEQSDLLTEVVTDVLPVQVQKHLATVATQDLPTTAKKDVVTEATQTLPPQQQKDVATTTVQTLSSQDRQQVAGINPSQHVTDQIWLIVMGTFAAVLLISAIALLYVAIWPPQGGS